MRNLLKTAFLVFLVFLSVGLVIPDAHAGKYGGYSSSYSRSYSYSRPTFKPYTPSYKPAPYKPSFTPPPTGYKPKPQMPMTKAPTTINKTVINKTIVRQTVVHSPVYHSVQSSTPSMFHNMWFYAFLASAAGNVYQWNNSHQQQAQPDPCNVQPPAALPKECQQESKW